MSRDDLYILIAFIFFAFLMAVSVIAMAIHDRPANPYNDCGCLIASASDWCSTGLR